MLAGDCIAVARPTEPLCAQRLERAAGSRLQWGHIKASAALKGCSAAVQLPGRGGHEFYRIYRRRDPFHGCGAHGDRGAVLGPLPRPRGEGHDPDAPVPPGQGTAASGAADGARRNAARWWQARRAAEVLAQLGSSRRSAFVALSWEWVLRANGQVAYRLATVDGRAERNPWMPVTQLAATDLPWLRQDRAGPQLCSLTSPASTATKPIDSTLSRCLGAQRAVADRPGARYAGGPPRPSGAGRPSATQRGADKWLRRPRAHQDPQEPPPSQDAQKDSQALQGAPQAAGRRTAPGRRAMAGSRPGLRPRGRHPAGPLASALRVRHYHQSRRPGGGVGTREFGTRSRPSCPPTASASRTSATWWATAAQRSPSPSIATRSGPRSPPAPRP